MGIWVTKIFERNRLAELGITKNDQSVYFCPLRLRFKGNIFMNSSIVKRSIAAHIFDHVYSIEIC
jgi:hypothetical protein